MNESDSANNLTLDQLLLHAHTLRGLRATLQENGLNCANVIHDVPRHVFDHVPGQEEPHVASSGRFWAKLFEGVHLFCNDPPVSETAEQPSQEEVTA